jgi:hypothetical protein
MRSLSFFNLPNLSSSIMALWFTLPLTEKSTEDISGGKDQPELKANILTAIYE